ncbi:MAG: hypothetical protein HY471_00505 [Candidatus Sungbacteria bacterium]|nr:hypothetical protein [Candidatus Sungbacteria bacterium]
MAERGNHKAKKKKEERKSVADDLSDIRGEADVHSRTEGGDWNRALRDDEGEELVD